MLAELHLTEDAFALHLLLQRPEGLVDIVVSDENLHVVFLLIQRLIGPTAAAPGPLAHGYAQLSLSRPESFLRLSLYSICRLQVTKNYARKNKWRDNQLSRKGRSNADQITF